MLKTVMSSFNNKEIYLLVYLIGINVFSFILYGIDKKKAERKKWRISEMSLLGVSLFGGSIGAIIGMVIFKHKLSKKVFYIGIPCLIVLNKIIEIVIFSYIKQ